MMRLADSLTLLVAMAASAGAQSYTINTAAGGGLPPTPMAAKSASIKPKTVTADSAGNVYFSSANAVFKIDAAGTLTRVAGSPGGGSPLGDGGPATSAYLNGPGGLALDSAGNLYIAEGNANRIRKVTPGGTISTVAGSGVAGYSGDGAAATSAKLNGPAAVAVDSAGALYIADAGNNVIRKVTAAGTISTVAGSGANGFGGNGGPATSAQFNTPTGVALDAAGNLYIADSQNAVVWKVSGGTISIVAGGGKATTFGGPATGIELDYPYGISVDSSGNLYIADPDWSAVFKVTPGGTITLAAGRGTTSPGDGGPATGAQLAWPLGVAADSNGNFYIADLETFSVRKVNASGTISTVAGNGSPYFGEGGPATIAGMWYSSGIAVDPAGNLYICDPVAQRVYKVTPAGIITTVAGNGTKGYSGDNGPAASAQLNSPEAVAVDASGNVYIADDSNNRIRKVTPAGIISTFAGTGTPGYSGDNGPATSAKLNGPSGLATDSAGDLFIADDQNYRIRKVTPGGTITTVVGTGIRGFSGDNGPATSAQINYIEGMAVDSAGNLYFGDPGNNRVRMVTSAGTISTIAGTGVGGFYGDNGPALSAHLNGPTGVAVDSSGDIFVTDDDNLRVRKFSVGGTITTIAGNGTEGYSGDGGPATEAQINYDNSIAVDSTGKVYVSDGANAAVRSLVPPTAVPSISPGGVVPLNSAVNTIQTGEWVSIWGSNLAGTTAVWKGDFQTTLGGTTVTIDGRQAYLEYVSPTQINVQVPDDSATGTVQVVVTTAGGSATSTVTLGAVAPSFLLLDSKHVAGIILRSDGSGAYGGGTYDIIGPTGSSLGYPTVAAKAGDIVELFATGFGPTNPVVRAGQAYSGAARTVDAVNVQIGTWNVTPMFAGLSGAGLVQINVTIAGGVGTGDVPLVATVGGAQTPAGVVISLQ